MISQRIEIAKRWWKFNRKYFGKPPPWDTNISPPELVEVIEGPEKLPTGKALDLGCGTGTNVIYMAAHGWQATGVDFIPRAIGQARRKAWQQGHQATFYTASVTHMPKLQTPFDLLLDMGCMHGLDSWQRQSYAQEVIRLSRPGTIYLLYVHARSARRRFGIAREEVESLFTPAFTIEKHLESTDTSSGGASAWYTLRRM